MHFLKGMYSEQLIKNREEALKTWKPNHCKEENRYPAVSESHTAGYFIH